MNQAPQGAMSLAGLQLLVGGLMAGVLALLAVALVVSPPGDATFALTRQQTLWLGVLSAMVVGAGVLVAVLGRVLVERSASNARGEAADDDVLLADFASLTIVRCAIVEGVGLLGATVYLVADLGIALLVAVTSLIGLGLLYPSAGRFETFRERVTRPV